MTESSNIEFKELNRENGSLPASLPKEIIAFSNTEGGEIYVGIRDDGSVSGVTDPDDVMIRISNIIHDTVLPNVMPFIKIRPVEIDNKTVVQISVSVGTERPYYLAKEGLRPKGVFVRVGSSCLPVNEAGIREMIMETSGKTYEESRSMNQELTFETMEMEMKSVNLEFGPVQKKTLKLIGEDGLYTNLGMLLSDQCEHSIKIAVFQGGENEIFRERREFTGSVLKQLKDVFEFLDFHNKTQAQFVGLQRVDQRDYPVEAIREALLNSILHRDYLFSGSNVINVFEDRIEFVSLGSLVRGISLDAVFLGVSQSRNPNLAAVFYRMGLVESYGTGVRKILRLYQGHSSPEFHAAEGAFSVVLRNQNERLQDEIVEDRPALYSNLAQIEQKEQIFQYLIEKGRVTRNDVEERFGFGTTKAYKYLKLLCDERKIIQVKNGNRTFYQLC